MPYVLIRIGLLFVFILFSINSYAGRINFSLTAQPKRLIPFLATDSASSEISSYIFNGLLKFDKDMNIVGDLAESYAVKNSGKTVVFHLRKNVFWQDGKPFSADDVIFTYKTIIDKKTPTPYAGKYKIIKSIKKLDNFTIEVSYPQPFAPALFSWMMGIIPKHIIGKEKNIATSNFNRKPIGTGSYTLKQWKTSQYLILDANKHYFIHKPYIDEIFYRIIPDKTTNLLELKSGNIDMMSLSPLEYKYEMNNFIKKHYNVYFQPSSGYTYIGFNMKEKLFSDIRVRKAICMAIDREMINKTILLGYGEVSDSIYPKNSPYYTKKTICSYNPKKALKLLNGLGWHLQKDGLLHKGSNVFKFTIYTNDGNAQRKYAAIMVQEYLRKIGIKVNLRILEWQAFIKMINERHFDAIILGWQLGADPDEYSLWHSKSDFKGGFNFTGFKDKRVDSLIEEGRRTFDKEKRYKIYTTINDLIVKQLPYIFLYYPTSITVVNKKFKGIKPAKAGIMHNFIEWQE
jgi:peptide/nickel transport system substrate-binding protein